MTSAVEVWLRAHTILVYIFLYIPIIIVVVFSFNATERQVTTWQGFSLKWYGRVLADRPIQSALFNSLSGVEHGHPVDDRRDDGGPRAAAGAALVPRPVRRADLREHHRPGDRHRPGDARVLSTSFDFLSPIIGFKLRLGFPTIIAAHCLFNISLVCLLIQARLNGMDRTHVEASYDLYGTPWRTFWQITFPQLLPAIVAGFLLSFTFSFDDYVITTFVSAAGTTTLPLYVFSQIRKGVTPATNAVAAVMLLITLGTLLIGQFLVSRNAKRRGTGASMASMVVDR